MVGPNDPLKNIPGTVVFTGEQCRRGAAINKFCMTLNKAENRAQFKHDEARYLDRFTLSPEERAALQARDYNRLLELGGNIYFLGKIAAADGESFQKLGARMSGVTEEEFRSMMANGGRPANSS
jgi:protocatechuate 4,5-dioxygenase alpha chain